MRTVLHLLALASALALLLWSVFLDLWPARIAQGVSFVLCLLVVVINVNALIQQRKS